LIGFGAEQRTTTSEQQKSGISYIVWIKYKKKKKCCMRMKI
jgi:hypothetical protein